MTKAIKISMNFKVTQALPHVLCNISAQSNLFPNNYEKSCDCISQIASCLANFMCSKIPLTISSVHAAEGEERM